MRSNNFWTIGLLLCVLSIPSIAQSSHRSVEELRYETISYSGIGDVKWTFPKEFDYSVVIPDRTMDHQNPVPQISCGTKNKEMCEIVIYASDPAIPADNRKEQLKVALLPHTLDSVERTIQFKTYGKNEPVLYATLTDKNTNAEFRYLTTGVYSRPPFVVWFNHLSNDSTQSQRTRILEIVHSVESLDAIPILALTFSNYAAACAERSPENSDRIQTTYAASSFSAVNFAQFLKRHHKPALSDEEIESQLQDSKASYVAAIKDAPADYVASLCGNLPDKIRDAEKSLRK